VSLQEVPDAILIPCHDHPLRSAQFGQNVIQIICEILL
jgi:hypothetical protein